MSPAENLHALVEEMLDEINEQLPRLYEANPCRAERIDDAILKYRMKSLALWADLLARKGQYP